jgi:hypothetical protein
LVHGLDEPSYAGRAWPMLLIQACATVAAVQRRRWLATIGSAILGFSAALSGISGFFDGQLARSDLDGVYVMAQVSYIVGLAVAAAIGRIWAIQRGRVHKSVSDVRM